MQLVCRRDFANIPLRLPQGPTQDLGFFLRDIDLSQQNETSKQIYEHLSARPELYFIPVIETGLSISDGADRRVFDMVYQRHLSQPDTRYVLVKAYTGHQLFAIQPDIENIIISLATFRIMADAALQEIKHTLPEWLKTEEVHIDYLISYAEQKVRERNKTPSSQNRIETGTESPAKVFINDSGNEDRTIAPSIDNLSDSED
ncbi:MAG: hypothetical protein KJ574_01680 [Nanoarchaeota archaeon]|nr:hypothetical protein [Nanoarchaeota archaeon]